VLGFGFLELTKRIGPQITIETSSDLGFSLNGVVLEAYLERTAKLGVGDRSGGGRRIFHRLSFLFLYASDES